MTIKSKLLATAAIVTVSAGAAFAQSNTDSTSSDASQNGTLQNSSVQNGNGWAPGWDETLDQRYRDIADRRVADLVGINVISDTGNDVGEIDTFVLLEDQLQAVVGVGGFLGLGEHSVAVPLSDMEYDGTHMIVNLTEDELRDMPEWTEELRQERLADDDSFRTRIGSDQAAMSDSASDDAAPTGEEVAAAEEMSGEEGETRTEQMAEAADGELEQEAEELAAETENSVENAAQATENAAAEAGEELAEAGEATENAVENAAAETEQMAENAAQATENAAEEAGQELAEAGEATENAAENAAAETGQMAENAAQATENAAEEAGQELAEAGEATENAAENAAAETEQMAENAASEVNDWVQKLEFGWADLATMQVNEFEGMDIATADGNVVGEIENLATMDGALVAIVGVGGFLGLGEHDVALDMNRLTWDGEKFTLDGATEADLENMPEVDANAVTDLDDDITLEEQARM